MLADALIAKVSLQHPLVRCGEHMEAGQRRAPQGEKDWLQAKKNYEEDTKPDSKACLRAKVREASKIIIITPKMLHKDKAQGNTKFLLNCG